MCWGRTRLWWWPAAVVAGAMVAVAVAAVGVGAALIAGTLAV
jgi:hypothetical protein